MSIESSLMIVNKDRELSYYTPDVMLGEDVDVESYLDKYGVTDDDLIVFKFFKTEAVSVESAEGRYITYTRVPGKPGKYHEGEKCTLEL